MSHTVGAVMDTSRCFALIFTAVEMIGSRDSPAANRAHEHLDRLAGGLLGAAIAAVFAGLAVMLMRR